MDKMDNIKFNENLAYDMDAIINFIFNDDARDSSVEITESQVADGDGKLVTEGKVIHEVKSSDGNKCTIKYDMVKLFIDVINNVEVDQEVMPLSLGERMILNTMVCQGMIKEVNGENK